jgi:pyridoxal phosphate enzyme (YggS family)
MQIGENIKKIKENIADAARRAGRREDEVKLMGVSKFFPREAVEAALQSGLTLFGESRVQEAMQKLSGLRGADCGFELHLIGALQRNKAKNAAMFFDGIDSLDRLEIIQSLGELTTGCKKRLMVLLELNSGEEQKGGFRGQDALKHAAELVLGFNGLKLCGLMTVAPFSGDKKIVRAAFRALANARRMLCAEFGEEHFPVLSMGMSGDYEIAIEEGSTLVRIGTAIFGERE